MLAAEYAGFEETIPSKTPALLLVEPLTTLALVWSFQSTNLIWKPFSVTRSGGLVFPSVEFGLWYCVNYAYSFLLIVAALTLIGSVYVRGNRIYRRQSALLILGAVMPLAANLVYNLFLGLNPPHRST